MRSPLVGGWGVARSTNAADSELYNLFLEVQDVSDSAKVSEWLQLCPGLDLVATVGSGPIRALEVIGTLLYVVSGTQVYTVTAAGAVTLIGTVAAGTGPLKLVSSGTQLLILDSSGVLLAPGGFPLTGGTVSGTQQNYNVGDIVRLAPASGSASASPQITITAVTGQNPVGSYTLNPQGRGYAGGDTGVVGGGNGDATYIITGIDTGGKVTSFAITAGGTGYATTTLAAMFPAGAHPGSGIGLGISLTAGAGAITASALAASGGTSYTTATNVTTKGVGQNPTSGSGFTVDITCAGGANTTITSSVTNNPGTGYAHLDTFRVDQGGSSKDAYGLVTSVGLSGQVTSFSIYQAGAVSSNAIASFTQSSTNGSGSGLTLTAPGYGASVGLAPITLPFSPPPTTGATLDGFVFVATAGNKKIWQSLSGDFSAFDALNFATTTQRPDNIIALHAIHDELFVLKTNSTEVWVNAGAAGFAFLPLAGVHIEAGCLAAFSVATMGETLVWLSRNDQGQGVVVQAVGYQLTSISTQAQLAEFSGYASLADPIGFSYQQNQHLYYFLSFPTADKAWCFDSTASTMKKSPVWHRRAAWDGSAWHRHLGNVFRLFSNSISSGVGVLGSYVDGSLYAFNLATLTDNGVARRWLRTWRALPQPREETTRYNSLRVDMETGSASGNVTLRWSDDGGHTFSVGSYVQPVNPLNTPVKFNRLGSTRRHAFADRIFELSSSDAFKVSLLGAEIDAS